MIGVFLLLTAALNQPNSPQISITNPASSTSVATMPVQPTMQEVWQVDAIAFLPPSNLASLKALTDDHTMDAVAAHLTKMDVKYLRGPTKFYPADHSPGFIKAVRSLPAHEPFVLPGNGVIVIYDFVSTSEEAVRSPPPAK